MNNDDNQNKAVGAAKRTAKKGGQAAKNGIKKMGKMIMFLFHFGWIGLIAVIVFIIIAMTIFLGAIAGGGTESGDSSSQSCSSISDNSGANASIGKIQHSNINGASHNYINRLYKSARKIAPRYGILPSVVLADAGQENPIGPGNNFWGVGFNDNTVVHNQKYQNTDIGVASYAEAAIRLTVGRIQTNNAQQGLRAMAEADGHHPPEQTYHTSHAYDNYRLPNGTEVPNYWDGISSQFRVYNLAQFDKGVHLNTHAAIGQLNDIKRTSNSSNEPCSTNVSNSGSGHSDIYNYAVQFNGKLPYSLDSSARLEFGNDLSHPKSTDQADCSSFVWGVLKAQGYQVTPNQWVTGDMIHTDKLQHISSKDARQGDIVVVNSHINQHAMIIASDKWYGTNDTTKVIDEGGMPGDHTHVNQNSYAYAMGGDNEQPTFLRAKK